MAAEKSTAQAAAAGSLAVSSGVPARYKLIAWTFSLSMGSMTDEPIFWADLIAKRGLDDIGVLGDTD